MIELVRTGVYLIYGDKKDEEFTLLPDIDKVFNLAEFEAVGAAGKMAEIKGGIEEDKGASIDLDAKKDEDAE